MLQKNLGKFRSVMVTALSATVLLSTNMGALTAQAAEVKPISFAIENVTANPGESVNLKISSSVGSGYTSMTGTLNMDERIAVDKVTAYDSTYRMNYQEGNKNLSFRTKKATENAQDKNVGTITCSLPEDIEAGKYDVDWDINYTTYYDSEAKGLKNYEKTAIRLSSGSITVPMTYKDNYSFQVENSEIKAGETSELNLVTNNPTGFSSFTAYYEAEGGIEITSFDSTTDNGITRLDNRTNRLILATKNKKNIDNKGTIAKIGVKVPEGTPAGNYDIKLTVDNLLYSYKNGTGTEVIPSEKISTVVGTIKVTDESNAPVTPTPSFDNYNFSLDTVKAEAGKVATLNLKLDKNAGFSSFKAGIKPEGKIIPANMKSSVGTIKFQKKTCEGIFTTSDSKNVTDDGVIATVDILIPKGTATGDYNVNLDISDLTYTLEDGSTVVIPAENIKTAAGKIQVVDESSNTPEPENPTPTFDTYGFALNNAEVKAGETAKLDIIVRSNNGYSSFIATFDAEDKLIPANLKSEIGITKFTKKTREGVFVSKNNKNETSKGSHATLEVAVPQGTPAGKYKVTMNVTSLTYTLEDGTKVEIPLENVTTVAGTVTVVEDAAVDPDPTPVDPDPTPVDPYAKELSVSSTLNNWGSGYQLTLKVANPTDKEISDWSLKINKKDIDIETIWCANLTEENGYYVITPLEWNRTLLPGTSTEIGMQGNGHVSNKVAVVVNGAAGSSNEPSNPGTDTPVVGEDVTLTDVAFGESIDLSAYDYNNISKIVVNFSGDAENYSGAVVLGQWNQSASFDNTTGNSVTVDVTSAQSKLTVYKWFSDTNLEIDNIQIIH